MKSLLKRFRNDEKGTVTIEFVLWLPVFIIIMSLVINTTMLMQTQTMMINVARDASRQVVLAAMTKAQAEEFARSSLNNHSYNIEVVESAQVVTTNISVPFSDVVMFGSQLAGDATLVAAIAMARE